MEPNLQEETATRITKLENIGKYCTLIWLVTTAVLGFWQWNLPETMTINEVGDFLGGMMGPIALLWLVLGYFLQREELKQNTEALKIQGEELKNQVEETRALVKQATRQGDIEERKLDKEISAEKPEFDWGKGGYSSGSGWIEINFDFTNIGGTAKNLSIDSSNQAEISVSPQAIIRNGEKGIIKAKYKPPLQNEQHVIFSYKDSTNKTYKLDFSFKDETVNLRKNPPKERGPFGG